MRDDLLAARARNEALQRELADARAKLAAAEKALAEREARELSETERERQAAARRAEAKRNTRPAQPGGRTAETSVGDTGDVVPDEPVTPGLIESALGLLSHWGEDD
ncbi:MAG: hypothetical protein KF729_36405 [Sandaracinaceae bacterium]|nr:hypothetical protein [Sandaracinaceae bacterium]